MISEGIGVLVLMGAAFAFFAAVGVVVDRLTRSG